MPMTETIPQGGRPPAAGEARPAAQKDADQRARRRAESLRENLRRRKRQQRLRRGEAGEGEA